MKYLLGIDLGTTATKGALYDENANTVASQRISYPLIQNDSGQASEDPQVIFDAVQKIIFNFSQKYNSIEAISWSSQMHSLIGLDKNKKLLTDSITWADNRSFEQVEKAKKQQLADKIYQLTGMPAHPMAPIYKLMWIKKEKPQLFSEVQYWLGIKEYIIFRLTGKIVTDPTMAAGFGLLDMKTLSWNSKLLKLINLKKDQLPNIEPMTKIISSILPEYKRKLGLSNQTKVVIGASDGYLSTIGVKALNKQDFALNIGTSGAVRVIRSSPIIDKHKRLFCYVVDKKHYLIGGPVNNGGIVFQWAKNTILGSNATSQEFIDLAEQASIGSSGLIFHPYLGGERAPIWNSEASGSFIGLKRNHTRIHLARSVIEGIILNIYQASHILEINTERPQAIRLTGGFVQSDFVRQIIADIFDRPVIAMSNQESGSFAAMFLARIGLGWNKDVDEIEQYLKEEKTYFPNQNNVKKYKDLFDVYCKVGSELSSCYKELAQFNEKEK